MTSANSNNLDPRTLTGPEIVGLFGYRHDTSSNQPLTLHGPGGKQLFFPAGVNPMNDWVFVHADGTRVVLPSADGGSYAYALITLDAEVDRLEFPDQNALYEFLSKRHRQ